MRKKLLIIVMGALTIGAVALPVATSQFDCLANGSKCTDGGQCCSADCVCPNGGGTCTCKTVF